MVIQHTVVVSSADSVRRVVANSTRLPGRTNAVLEANERYFLTTLAQLRRIADDDDDDDRRRTVGKLRGRYVGAVDHRELTEAGRHPAVVVLERGAVTGVLRPRAKRRPASTKGTRGPTRAVTADAAAPVGADDGNAQTAEFRAYAAVDNPRSVRAGETFTLAVGFSPEGDADDIVVDPNAPPTIVFEVQAAGIGFSFPDGVRRTLAVPRADPTRGGTTFTITADEVGHDRDATLLITFERGGVLCGKAFRVVHVHTGEMPPAKPELARQPPDSGPVTEAATAIGADLTVQILPGEGILQWRISSRHPNVRLPSNDVRKPLGQDSVRTFAQDMVEKLNDGTQGDELWMKEAPCRISPGHTPRST